MSTPQLNNGAKLSDGNLKRVAETMTMDDANPAKRLHVAPTDCTSGFASTAPTVDAGFSILSAPAGFELMDVSRSSSQRSQALQDRDPSATEVPPAELFHLQQQYQLTLERIEELERQNRERERRSKEKIEELERQNRETERQNKERERQSKEKIEQLQRQLEELPQKLQMVQSGMCYRYRGVSLFQHIGVEADSVYLCSRSPIGIWLRDGTIRDVCNEQRSAAELHRGLAVTSCESPIDFPTICQDT